MPCATVEMFESGTGDLEKMMQMEKLTDGGRTKGYPKNSLELEKTEGRYLQS